MLPVTEPPTSTSQVVVVSWGQSVPPSETLAGSARSGSCGSTGAVVRTSTSWEGSLTPSGLMASTRYT